MATSKLIYQFRVELLEIEPSIGLLLPCNVVVRQVEAGTVHVEFMDPNAVLELVNKPEITALASEVRQRLERVSVALGGSEEAPSAQADETMAKVKVDTRQMQASMEKIQQAQDPQEQQRLMREHMQQMRETMRSMGGEMHGKCMCCGH